MNWLAVRSYWSPLLPVEVVSTSPGYAWRKRRVHRGPPAAGSTCGGSHAGKPLAVAADSAFILVTTNPNS